ncbi:Winged helix-turn-helix transcription repressor, HrcA DNA-binding [Natronorubrum sediminis]|uniref:Winged helix-turn-helix transcription repressor, HrcA DNA-binding n=1 Tax=Natronorubrum sediminis TaxID=640943 RepID=A0A1H6G4V1_9EURY|nr:Winged helix-turn-helix transcription repressor, HrcA DNA-binding [Natronorubrum sediminis]
MSSIELTPSQKKILRALTNLHKESEGVIKGEDIAEQVDRNQGQYATRCRVSRR